MFEDAVEIDPENLRVGGEVTPGSTVVKGRLKKCVSFWKEEVTAPPTIISMIESGYVLPLKSEPNPYVGPNHQSACVNASFVQECILELCATGCAVEILAVICSPLSVVESSSGRRRLVVNLRHLIINRFLWKQKFKYEDL